MQIVIITAVFLLALGVVSMFALSLTAAAPSNLGVVDGRLADLPGSPNCVSTQTENQDQWMAPLTFDDAAENVTNRIRDIIQSMPHSRVVEQQGLYLRAEFRSTLFRFVDDVEFLVEPETGRVHFRSASRVGYSDMGVNRTRMKEIRSRFQNRPTE